MKLEVGGYYVLRNGEKVGPLNNDGHHKYPFDNGVLSWTKEGHMYHFEGAGHPLDIVAIDPTWKAVSDAVDRLETDSFGPTDIQLGKSMVAEDYIDELVAAYPSKAQLLMERDEGFRKAAERLANKLAHALLTNVEVYRRANQKALLWEAACSVLASRGANVSFCSGFVRREG